MMFIEDKIKEDYTFNWKKTAEMRHLEVNKQ